jgi:electron transfer flavoprotein beta subunit
MDRASVFIANRTKRGFMRVLTIISQSLDAEETVRMNDGRVSLTSSKLTLDKMDEYGVEEALRLRERGLESEIIAVGVGPSELETALRAALALGADRAVHVQSARPCDVLEMALSLASVCAAEEATLVFVGGQQGNLDTHALGPAIAEHLGWPQITWVNSLEYVDGKLKGLHDVEDGQESFEVELPVVVTTQQGLNEPRYPTVLNIRRSNQKELKQVVQEKADQTSAEILEQTLEARARMGLIIEGKDPSAAAEQLVRFLREEAKVVA